MSAKNTQMETSSRLEDAVRKFLHELEDGTAAPEGQADRGHSASRSDAFTLAPTSESQAVRLPNRAERLAARRGVTTPPEPRAEVVRKRDLLPPLEPPEEEGCGDPEPSGAGSFRFAPRAMVRRLGGKGSLSRVLLPVGVLVLGAVWFLG